MVYRPIEPRLSDVLSDPVVSAMMAADKVDRDSLTALIAEMAQKLAPKRASLERCA